MFDKCKVITLKVLMRPVEMIVLFDREGIAKPLRFKITAEDKSNTVVKIDQVISRTEEKLPGKQVFIYKCQSEINGIQRLYELKYESSTCRWFLFKM